MKDLLFEIGTEEIPAGFLGPAADQFEQLFTEKASALNLAFSSVKKFSTPRRLALLVRELAERQEDSTEILLGPSRQAAFDPDGNPTKAAEGFARSKGVSVEDLEIVQTDKGEYLQLVRHVEGTDTGALLPTVLQEIILELSFPKSMKWGANQHTFARPIQWLTALYGDRPVEMEHEGIISGTNTRGHRFMAPEQAEISDGSSYEATLDSIFVISDFEKRRQKVVAEINAAVEKSDFDAGAQVSVDEGLLETVTNLVEYPFGVCGRFDDKFLQIPSQVLVTSMREHQKYFPIVDKNNSLLPGFVAVNNTRVKDAELTRQGHERVLRARLEDAFFFYESDKKKRLEERVEQLSGIIFQAKLGSMQEKVERIVKLARILSERLEPSLVEQSCRAALLCKADLITDMVGEFPSLQGVMGGAYAKNDGEDESVCAGIQEHYMPLRAGAPIPPSAVGAIVGLADRIDTIAGCFGIGQMPTGTADPFGLRRLSLAVLHIIEERGYDLPLGDMFSKALSLYGDKVDASGETVETIISFIQRRFVNDCVAREMNSRAVEAVASAGFDNSTDCLARIAALAGMQKDASFAVLAGSFKRIRNITKDHALGVVDPALLSEPAELKLYEVFQELQTTGGQQLKNRNYPDFLSAMLVLKEPVDTFFDDVMVMAEDETVRQNRLNLLAGLGELILQVGDISKMHEGS